MSPRYPELGSGPELGVGLDLHWGSPNGFVHQADRDVVSDRVVGFLHTQREALSHLFVSFQLRSRNRLDARDYFDVYDDLFARLPPYRARALHQTCLNLGALEPYDRGPIIDLSNAFAERYDLAWVNEDLGLWSIHGRPLPYPLPPYLTEEGLRAAVRNATFVRERLAVPLLVEFPGFSAGTSFVIGRMHAFDHFRRVVEDSGSAATLDLGHLLSYQWFRGKRGGALYEELELLPLEQTFELHLSGCRIDGERFLDLHDGVLLDEQLELLRILAPRCPRLRAITYEDPRFDEDGALATSCRPSFDALRQAVAALREPS